MTQALAFGTYIPGTSPIHALNAQVKVILACVFSIAVFFVESWPGLLVITAFVAMLYMLARVPVTKAARGLVPVAFILVGSPSSFMPSASAWAPRRHRD